MADFTQEIVFNGVDNVSKTITSIMGKIGLLGTVSAKVEMQFMQVARTGTILASRLKYIGLAAAGVASAVFWMAYRTSDAAESLLNLSQKTGVSVEELQKLNYVAEQSNVATDSLSQGFKFLNKAISDASHNADSEASVTFKALGVNLTNLDGTTKSTEQVFYDLSDAFAKTPDGADKVSAAVKLLGRAGTELIPILNKGSDSVHKQGDEFAKYSNLITQKGLQAIADFNSQVDTAIVALKGIGSIIAQAVIPYLAPLVTAFSDFVANNKELIKLKIDEWLLAIHDGFNKLLPKVMDAWDTFMTFWDAIGGFETVITALGVFIAGDLLIAFANFSGAIIKLGVLLLATPIGWLIAGLAAIAYAVYELNKVFPGLADAVAGTISIMVEKFKWFFDYVWGGIQKTLEFLHLIDKEQDKQTGKQGKLQTVTTVDASGKATTITKVIDETGADITGTPQAAAIAGVQTPGIDYGNNGLTAAQPNSPDSFNNILSMLADFSNNANKPMEVNIKLDTQNEVINTDIDAPLTTNVSVNSGAMISY